MPGDISLALWLLGPVTPSDAEGSFGAAPRTRSDVCCKGVLDISVWPGVSMACPQVHQCVMSVDNVMYPAALLSFRWLHLCLADFTSQSWKRTE